MFEGDSADMCAEIFSLGSMGGREEGLACADHGAWTPIGASGNFKDFFFFSALEFYFYNVYLQYQVFQVFCFMYTVISGANL